MKQNKDSSWENVHAWYDRTVGDKGHYFHRNIVIPKSLALLNIENESSLLDLACGQGILEKHIPERTKYLGIDRSPSLIKAAAETKTSANHQFITEDITKKLELTDVFTHITCILALQNIEDISGVFKNAQKASKPGTNFLIVLNHPYFRIPRHSSWQNDETNNSVYRRMNRYMSLLKIPILMNPGSKENKEFTTSFHYPLHYISTQLLQAGFRITKIEEWISDKESVGKHAKAENTARKEFPLFMAILATYV